MHNLDIPKNMREKKKIRKLLSIVLFKKASIYLFINKFRSLFG